MRNLKQSGVPNEKKIINMPDEEEQIDDMEDISMSGNDDIKMEDDEEDDVAAEEGNLEDVEDGIEEPDEDNFENEENKPTQSVL